MHLYDVLSSKEGWIYFQTRTVSLESDGVFPGENLSKIRLDGSEISKLDSQVSQENVYEPEVRVRRDGFEYYAQYNLGDDQLYKKDLETGEETLLVSKEGYIRAVKLRVKPN